MLETSVNQEDLLQGIGALVWEADAEALHFTFVSRHAEKLLGYPADRWTRDSSWGDHIHPADRERALAECRELVRNGTDGELEYRAVTADGAVVWVRDSVRLSRTDGRRRNAPRGDARRHPQRAVRARGPFPLASARRGGGGGDSDRPEGHRDPLEPSRGAPLRLYARRGGGAGHRGAGRGGRSGLRRAPDGGAARGRAVRGRVPRAPPRWRGSSPVTRATPRSATTTAS